MYFDVELRGNYYKLIDNWVLKLLFSALFCTETLGDTLHWSFLSFHPSLDTLHVTKMAKGMHLYRWPKTCGNSKSFIICASLSPIYSPIHALTSVSVMQGNRRLVGSPEVSVSCPGTPQHQTRCRGWNQQPSGRRKACSTSWATTAIQ